MKHSNYYGRAPRTLQAAFGPYTDDLIYGSVIPTRPSAWVRVLRWLFNK